MKKLSKRELLRSADIVTDDVRVTYFPFPEHTRQVGYSAGACGCTAQLYRGMTSGALYATDRYGHGCDGNPARDFLARLGNRERAVIERLDHIENVEASNGRATFSFVAFDGSRFTVTSTDHGKTWEICG